MELFNFLSVLLLVPSCIAPGPFSRAWGAASAAVADHGSAVPLLADNPYGDEEFARPAQYVERVLSEQSPIRIEQAPPFKDKMLQYVAMYEVKRDISASRSPYNFRMAYEDAIRALQCPIDAFSHYYYQIYRHPRFVVGVEATNSLQRDLLSTLRVVEDEFYKLKNNFAYKDSTKLQVCAMAKTALFGSACLQAEVNAFDVEVAALQLKINGLMSKMIAFLKLFKFEPYRPDVDPPTRLMQHRVDDSSENAGDDLL